MSGPKDPFEGERNVDLSQLRYSHLPRLHTVEKRCENFVRTGVSFYIRIVAGRTGVRPGAWRARAYKTQPLG